MLRTLSSRRLSAFTMMELMIAIAIVGIIAAIAVPSYLDYTRKAYFSEIVRATAPYKLGIAECYHTQADLMLCNSGQNGVPTSITNGIGGVATLIVKEGTITVVPAAKNCLQPSDTYVLTPDVLNGGITWESSGGGVTKGYAR